MAETRSTRQPQPWDKKRMIWDEARSKTSDVGSSVIALSGQHHRANREANK